MLISQTTFGGKDLPHYISNSSHVQLHSERSHTSKEVVSPTPPLQMDKVIQVAVKVQHLRSKLQQIQHQLLHRRQPLHRLQPLLQLWQKLKSLHRIICKSHLQWLELFIELHRLVLQIMSKLATESLLVRLFASSKQ